MNNLSFLRGSTLLAILLLVFGLVTTTQAQTNSSALLNDAYATLAQAKHDYKGHRVRAMKQIEAALGELGGKISSTGRNHEPQGTSDAQLRAAQGLLDKRGPDYRARPLNMCRRPSVKFPLRCRFARHPGQPVPGPARPDLNSCAIMGSPA